MLGGLSLLSVVTAAITSGFISRAETHRRGTGDDPVMQKLDQLASELQAVKTDLERRGPRTGSPGSTEETPRPSQPASDEPLTDHD